MYVLFTRDKFQREVISSLHCQDSHLFVVLLHISQLLFQCLDLHLQVSSGQGQLIQDPAQAIDVGLYALAQEQLVLIPAVPKRNKHWNMSEFVFSRAIKRSHIGGTVGCK